MAHNWTRFDRAFFGNRLRTRAEDLKMTQPTKLPFNTHSAIDVLNAIANENRLKVLCLLLEKERTVTDLCNKIGLAQSPLSQHLAKLRKMELVGTRRDGQLIYYHLRSEAVRDLLALLKDLYPNDRQGQDERT